MIRVQDQLLHVGWIEVEDAGFAVIEPDDGVVVAHAAIPCSTGTGREARCPHHGPADGIGS